MPNFATPVIIQLNDVVEPAEFLSALDTVEHAALAATIDNAGAMPPVILQHNSQVCQVKAEVVRYYRRGCTADAFHQ